MSLIIAARFPTFEAADAAAKRLMQEGIHEEAMHVFYVNPPGAHAAYPIGGDQAADPGTRPAPKKALGTAAILGGVGAIVGGMIVASFADTLIPIVAGAGVGAYIGSLAGAMGGMDRRRNEVQQAHPARVQGEGRPAGVMLAVNAEDEGATRVATLLKEAGGEAVERAQGRWSGGKWQDFDPTATPVPEAVRPQA